jgi:hypothetical protein
MAERTAGIEQVQVVENADVEMRVGVGRIAVQGLLVCGACLGETPGLAQHYAKVIVDICALGADANCRFEGLLSLQSAVVTEINDT